MVNTIKYLGHYLHDFSVSVLQRIPTLATC